MPNGLVTQVFLGSGGVVNSGTALSASGMLGAMTYVGSGEVMDWLSASGKPGYILQADASGNPVWTSGLMSGAGGGGGSGFSNPMTTSGDIICGTESGAAARFAIGASGDTLRVGADGSLAWQKGFSSGPSLSNPMNTSGDIIYGTEGGAPARLGVGGSGDVLGINAAGTLAWQKGFSSGSLTNPMNTSGDLIYGTQGGTPARFAIGASGDTLQVGANGSLAWQKGFNSGPALSNPMTTNGDMIYGQAAGAVARLSGGSNGYILQWWSGIPQWVSGVSSGWIDPSVFPYRISAASGDACPATDVTAAANIHLEPQYMRSGMTYSGQLMVTLNNGSGWQQYPVSGIIPQISLALSVSSGSLYDVFCYPNNGAPALELGTAWTNATTRASGLVEWNGIPLAAWDRTRRYVGTIQAIATNQTEDSQAKRFVINLYNAVPRTLFTCPGYSDGDSNTTYTISATSWAEVNGGTNSKVEFLVPLPGWVVDATGTFIAQTGGAGFSIWGGISLDSTTAPSVGNFIVDTFVACYGSVTLRYSQPMSVAGYHYLDLLGMRGGANGAMYADVRRFSGGADPYATYLKGWIMG